MSAVALMSLRDVQPCPAGAIVSLRQALAAVFGARRGLIFKIIVEPLGIPAEAGTREACIQMVIRILLSRTLACAAFLLFACNVPSSAQTPNGVLSANKAKPGEAVESVGPAALRVLATVPYQVQLELTCPQPNYCNGTFPVVPANRQIQITRINCILATNTVTTYASGNINLWGSRGQFRLSQYLPLDYSGSTVPAGGSIHMVNPAISVFLNAGEHMDVTLFSSGPTAYLGRCSATGTLNKLG